MSIRLNKVTRELNVGLSTVVEFLQKKGFDAKEDPNAKISDDEYELLVKEFNKDLNLKQESDIFSKQRLLKDKKETVAVEGYDQPRSIKTEIPEDYRPKFVIVDKIDLDSVDKKKPDPVPEKTEEKKEIIEVKKETIIEPKEISKAKQPEEEIKIATAEEIVKETVAPKTELPEIEEEKIIPETPKPEIIKPEVVKEEKAAEVEIEAKVEVEKIEPIVQKSEKQPTPQESQKPKEPQKVQEQRKPQKPQEHKTPQEPKKDAEQKETTPQPVVEKTPEIKSQPVEPAQTTETPAPAKMEEIETATPVEQKEKEEEEVFRYGKPIVLEGPKVTGKIDLATLPNERIRPKKKSKREKERERAEKRKKEAEMRRAAARSDAHNKQQERKDKPAQSPAKPMHDKPQQDQKPREGGNAVGTNAKPERRQRERIKVKGERVDTSKPIPPVKRDQQSHKPPLRKPIRNEINEEDVQKQVKETLARLQNKGQKKGAKYRKEKREAVSLRQSELQEQEMQESKIIKITEFVTANDLANMMNIPVNEIISTCMSIGLFVSINQRMDAETINLVADEFGFKTEYVSAEVVEAIAEDTDKEEDLIPRPPIVTVMGHVDHGKTSLLDNIRKTNVIAGEAGGITQHIGAYHVTLSDGRKITFLDTPGHEAFTAMRARGASVTDIAIIIVAADDNVMPQTIEAINHASAANVPMVFAINKIDKPGANPDKIKESLAAMNYLVEEWGGKYQSQDISAKQGIGVRELLEKVLLEAELLELKANPQRKAVGSVIESSLDKGRGYVVTMLVQNGTLKMGDIILAGTHFGRVKAMFNERNQKVTEAGPAEPVLILGLNGAPQAGDTIHVMETEQEAREIATKREQLQREQGLRTQKLLTLDDIGRRIAIGNFQQLNIIVKGDVDGSVEALSDSLIRLSTEKIQVNVIHKGVGQISESDVILAAASDAIIVGFQVRPSQAARKSAEKEGVDIRLYSIIYDAIGEVKAAMEGMLSPEIKEEITGNVEIREVFKISKVGSVAGCMVKDGKIKRGNKIRLIRDGIVIYTGELGSLKRFKDDVKEVATGFECGLNIHNFNDIKVGDIIEAFEEVEVKQTL